MNTTQIDKVTEEFPDLFKRAWEVSVGDGWAGILRQLCVDIEKLNEKLSKSERTYFVQVKEKFGDLRIYVNQPTEKVNELINMAERMSANVCESCGGPGIKVGEYWIKTMCQACWSSRRGGSCEP